MFAHLDGIVADKGPGMLVIDCHGVGYLLSVSGSTLSQAPAVGERMKCYTFLSVREDAMELFGFATREEKRMFQQLTSISGVGPKLALAILGSMPLRELNLAILLGDVTALCRAPGVGKKTAQRIALELKDKLGQFEVSGSTAASPAAAMPAAADNFAQAIAGLTALGYTPGEARDALSKVENKDAPVDELLRLALRSMAGM